MRLILAALFVALAGALGWAAGTQFGLIGPAQAPDRSLITGSTDAAALRASGQPVRVVHGQATGTGPVLAQADQPNDLTAPRASGGAGAEGAGGTTGAPSPVINPPMPDIDESALRYFARTGDQRRLEAEMARLKLLYPDWIPPANPAAPAAPAPAPVPTGGVDKGSA